MSMLSLVSPRNRFNIILAADSYKDSHFDMIGPDIRNMHFYISARGGAYSHAVAPLMKMIVKMFFSRPIDQGDIDEAREFSLMQNGSFNDDPETGWPGILKYHNGYMPLRIRSLPEGTVVKTGVPLSLVLPTDPRFVWLAGYFETLIQRYVWISTTIATNSYYCKLAAIKELNRTLSEEEVKAVIAFMVNDFGARGVMEPIFTGGAHLLSFMGSDNKEATYAINKIYNAAMSSYSIAASEHSIMTLRGRAGESAMADLIVNKYGPQGKMFAMVMDSYDIDNFIDVIIGKEQKDNIIKYGTEFNSKFVGRPDSGVPTQILPYVNRKLMNIFGYREVNGFDRLPPYVGTIQGDGIDRFSMVEVMKSATYEKIAGTNYCFGSGGGLLQKFDRDTMAMAMKLSAVEDDDGWRGTSKNAPGKKSLEGRVGAYWVHGGRTPICLTEEVAALSPMVADAMKDFYVKDMLLDAPLYPCDEEWGVITERLANFNGGEILV